MNTAMTAPMPREYARQAHPTLTALGLLALLLSTGCTGLPRDVADPATAGRTLTVADGHSVQLLPGDSARLADGSTLRFERVISDSRCPPDVQCIWAGDAQLLLHWQPSAAISHSLQLHINTRIGPDRATLPEGNDGLRRSVQLTALGHAQPPRATLHIQRDP